jgi:hypothetical protein
MKFPSIFITLCLIPVLSWGQPFSRQVYILSDHFSKEKCEVSVSCDCCASELIFLTPKKFTLVDRCVDHDTYLTGRYTVKKSTLTLKFKPVIIDNTYDEKNKKEFFEKKKVSLEPLMLQIRSCGDNKTIIEHPTIREYKYGSRQTNKKDQDIITALKKSTAWKKL